ncbi:MAG: hypothetical protein DHS20C15_28360 [Planctomycetota bacterium]|nr:MAG: hypothetical protein DHS20C15_28360 [Planctomycetota bacterium]
MPDWLLPALLAALFGALAGALWMRAQARRREEQLQVGLREAEANAEQFRGAAEAAQRELVAETARRTAREEASAEAQNSFDALAGKALDTASERFLKLAQERLGKSEQQGSAELEKRKEAIQALLKPLGDSLGKLQTFQQELESKRERAYGSLETHLSELKLTATMLGDRSQALEQALRGSSQVRGRWGEIVLRRLVEMAGMVEHCNFTEQTQDSQGLRPDMIVMLPENGRIPIDSKVPLDAYASAMEASDPADRERFLKNHATALRGFVNDLGRKDYAAAIEGRIDFTVLFVPAEPMLAAAFESNPNLLEEALDKGILLATPVTLMALLKTVSLYWSQVRLSENAQLIGDAAAEYSKRVRAFSDHLVKIGKGIDSSLKAYNQAVGSFERKVRPQARKLVELGGGTTNSQEPSALDEIDNSPRELSAGD